MASTIAAITTGVGGVVTTADASGNLNLLAGTTTVVAVTTAGAAVSGTLSATGVATFPAGTVALPSITTSGDTNTGVYFPAADTVGIAGGGVLAMSIAQGVTQINTASNANPVSFSLATGGSNRASISIANSSSDLVIKSEDAGARNQGIQFWTGNASAERMRISSAGLVGIGTSAPTLPLTVDGEVSTVFDNNGTALEATAVFIGNGSSASTATHARVAIIGSGTGTVGELFFTNRGLSSYNSYGSGIRGGYAGADARNNILTFFTSKSTEENVERMRIDSSGNVGIGTSSPTTTLAVAGTLSATGQTSLTGGALRVFGALDAGQLSAGVMDWQSVTNRTRFLSYGPTGVSGEFSFTTVIGGGAGSVPVVISSTGLAVTGTLSATGVATFAAGTVALPSITTSGDTNTGIYFPAADNVGITTGGAERMRINSSGNVGIGTSSPLTALNVNGTGGELLRISVTPDAGVIQEPALGFATGLTNTHPAAKISALEFDVSDSRASLLFYTRGSNTDVAPTERMRISSTGLVTMANGLAVTGALSASTVLQMPDGVVGTPGLRVGTSSVTGLFSSADNSLRVSCSGSQIASFTGTGLAVTGALSATGTVTATTYAGAGTSLTGTANSLNAGIGVNQTWTSVPRAIGTTYTNSTGKPITVAISLTCSNANTVQGLNINGTVVYAGSVGGAGTATGFSLIVPNGATYVTATNGGTLSLVTWYELR